MSIKLFIKPGVRIRGISPEILLAVEVAKSVYESNNEETMTITSITDGDHKAGSLHHTGDAVDLRMPKHIAATVIKNDLTAQLNGNYDVVIEVDHIHIEYDPG